MDGCSCVRLIASFSSGERLIGEFLFGVRRRNAAPAQLKRPHRGCARGDHIGTWPFHACLELKRFFSLIFSTGGERTSRNNVFAKIFPYNSSPGPEWEITGKWVWFRFARNFYEIVNERGGKLEIVRVYRMGNRRRKIKAVKKTDDSQSMLSESSKTLIVNWNLTEPVGRRKMI